MFFAVLRALKAFVTNPEFRKRFFDLVRWEKAEQARRTEEVQCWEEAERTKRAEMRAVWEQSTRQEIENELAAERETRRTALKEAADQQQKVLTARWIAIDHLLLPSERRVVTSKIQEFGIQDWDFE